MTVPAAIALDEAVAALHALRFDPEEPGAWVEAEPILVALSADRHLLAAIAIAELTGTDRPSRAQHYGAQVILLDTSGGRWLLRANLWPAEDDPLCRASGRSAFFYDLPHDHNFSFLTVGHHGPGYDSDHWEVLDEPVGLPGEAARLRFLGRERLGPGSTRFYRAHVDVHDQKPPAAFSVTLNLMESSGREPWRDQYRFEPARGRLAEPLNATACEAMLGLAAHLGGEEGAALLDDFARAHPVDRIRFGAVAARAGAARGEARLVVLEAAARLPDPYLAARAGAAARRTEQALRWSSAPEEMTLPA